jgi:hypothetical protein
MRIINKNYLKSKIGEICKIFLNDFSGLAVFIFHEVTDYPSEHQIKNGLFHKKKEFINIIKWINNNFQIIGPSSINNAINNKSAIITFDDGFIGNFDFAIKYLISKKIPSISFLNLKPVLKENPNIVSTVQFLRDNNINFKKFMQKHGLSYNVHLDITPKLFKSFLLNNKKINIDQILLYQGRIVDLKTVIKFSKNEYVFYANHLYEHWNSKTLTNSEFKYYYEKNFLELKKFNNSIDFLSFPHGFLRKNYLKIINKSYYPKKSFIYKNGINKNGFENILNRISLNSLNEVKNIFYYNILRDKIQKTFNV